MELLWFKRKKIIHKKFQFILVTASLMSFTVCTRKNLSKFKLHLLFDIFFLTPKKS